MSTILHETESEGFKTTWFQDEDGRVHCLADGDIDADGANGLNGGVAAYRRDDTGSELLANGGMKRVGGRIVWAEDWGKDIVLHGPDGFPLVLADGSIPSLTAWRDPAKSASDASAYADAETVPYLVVPGTVRQKAKGVVLGCRGRITDTRTQKSVLAGVLDIGPRRKSGELSIAAARAIGIHPSPRTGGIDDPVLLYEFWPNEAFVHEVKTFTLVRA